MRALALAASLGSLALAVSACGQTKDAGAALDDAGVTAPDDAAAVDGAIVADDGDGIRTYCAAAGACAIGPNPYADFGACVNATVLEALSHTRDRERAALVACARATPGDCAAISACYAGPVVERPACANDPYASFCEGDALVSCSGNFPQTGGTTDPKAARVVDCAAGWNAGALVNGGPHCVDLTSDAGGAAHRAACGAGRCDGRASGWTCKPGDLLLRCDYSGLLSAENCAAEGLRCPESQQYGYGSCVSPTSTCTAGYSPLACEGSRLVQRCGGVVVSSVDCAARTGWTCTDTPYGYPGQPQCLPVANDCYPGDASQCQNGKISYCEDGKRIGFVCAAKGFDACGPTPNGYGVRCSAP